MASKRMFSNEIISSDAFMSMPLTTQALYFHLCMNADDDGFVDKPKAIMRLIGANEDDIKILLGKRYILAFESGIIVIKHWFIHNWIRQDRLKPTNYQEELSLLVKKENGAYTEKDKRQSSVSQVSVKCQHRLDKSSIDKYNIDKINNIHTFTPPTLEEVKKYCQERSNNIDAETFIDFYKSKGWMIGKNKMKDWKASIRTWEKANKEKNQKETTQQKNQRKLNAIGEALGKIGEVYEQHRDTKNIGEN